MQEFYYSRNIKPLEGYWYGPYNSEACTTDEDDTLVRALLLTYTPHQREQIEPLDKSKVNLTLYTMSLQRPQDCNLRHSSYDFVTITTKPAFLKL
ncbi:hypothetical protein TNCV_4928001 [Trichonephila clavipes]|nr:hypothetical protein TNCV_4928001 [Trichonephila clavipes]